jgi:hypothetical protein
VSGGCQNKYWQSFAKSWFVSKNKAIVDNCNVSNHMYICICMMNRYTLPLNCLFLQEEEWKEVEEEAEKDYSGLRIANLQVM